MIDQDIISIKHKTLKGIVALTTRTMVMQTVAFIAMFLLTLFLDPAIFGVYYIVTAIISFLTYFSDIGLAAALIQKKEELTKEDLSTTFTIQQILVGSIVLITWFISKTLGVWYGFDNAGIWLLKSLIFSFFLSSLKTIPSILLERKLEFKLLVIPQMLETLVFYTVSVILAWKGYGVWSFAWAVIFRSIVGLIVIYYICPWRWRIGINIQVFKRLLKYGLPFQLNSLLALVKDDLLTIVLGKILPLREIGYIGWAKKWAEMPLRLIMDSVIRVTFPTFSRIQHSKSVLGTALEKTLYGISLTVFPITTAMVFFISPLALLIPRYSKWEPAFLSFIILAITSAIASMSTPLTNAINAVGKIKITLMLMIFWTIATWFTTLLFTRIYGFNGVAFGLFIVSLTAPLTLIAAKYIANFSFINSIKGPFICSLFQSIFYWFGLFIFSEIFNNLISYSMLLLTGVILYSLLLWHIDKRRLKATLGDFRGVYRWKK